MHQSDNDSCSSNSPAIAPRNGRVPSRILSNSVATLLGVIALGTAAAQAELWTYTGSANDWTIGWTDGVAGDPAPPGVDGGSYTNIRLEIAGVVTYGPEQGNQT